MDKRGLSGVIITVLIILISIAAIFIVWQVLKPSLKEAASGVNLNKITVDLELKRYSYQPNNPTPGNYPFNITVIRNPGDGELSLVKVTVENETTSAVYDFDASGLVEMGEKKLTVPSTIANATKVTITPVVKTASGSSEGGIADTYVLRDVPTSSTPTCSPNWQCTSWSPNPCTAGQTQTRTCTDANSCDTTSGKPAESQSCQVSCTPNWQCTSWSVCSGGQQTRTCTDANSCDTTSGKPAESQSCTISVVPTDYFAYWKFDSIFGSTQTVDKKGKNNLSINDWGTNVQYNPASSCVSNTNCFKYKENGDSFVDKASINSASKVYALSFWINPTNFSKQKRNVLSYFYSGGPSLYSGFEVYNQTLWVRGGTDQSDSNSLSAPITNNTWTHIVFNYDANGFGYLYINGALITSKGIYTSSYSNPNAITTGSNWNYFSQYWPAFSGALDELMIYNRTLSTSEIQALYTADYSTM